MNSAARNSSSHTYFVKYASHVKDADGKEQPVYICDECIALCGDVIKEEIKKNPQLELDGIGGEQPLKKPSEIKAFLDQ